MIGSYIEVVAYVGMIIAGGWLACHYHSPASYIIGALFIFVGLAKNRG